MLVVDGENYLSPREITNKGYITNRKGKPDYNLVLRLIKSGKLPSIIYNEDSKTPYYLVPESKVVAYNSRFKL